MKQIISVINILMTILYIFCYPPNLFDENKSVSYFQNKHATHTPTNMCKIAFASIKYIMNTIRKFVTRK
jgi:hypothetical protein